jgi:alkylated DNA repair dioxygenase AlkB
MGVHVVGGHAGDLGTATVGGVPDAPHVRPDVAFERTWLDDDSWVDVARGWLVGADEVYDALTAQERWSQGRIFRYDRWVDVPRLGSVHRPGTPPPHPVLAEAQRAVQQRYKVQFAGFALAWYRDGRDSQAFHRDRDLRWLDDTVIALLSLGAQRPWLLRPRANRYDHEAPDRGATLDVAPAGGDLHVMGGRAQVGWEHSVPKLGRRVGGRISVQWRWTSRRGRPVEGASWSAPRHYSGS